MANIVVKERAKKTESVFLAYIEDSSSIKRSKSTIATKNVDASKKDMFDKKAAQMEAMLDKFSRPARK
ncbi:MAG: hypothetical protein ABIN80_26270 [Dyadobacter sp.]|uniref:hypothetical protein n=1 Tax=Dyadobacter sp. TaxID=1914288 RepID=UPI003266B1D7